MTEVSRAPAYTGRYTHLINTNFFKPDKIDLSNLPNDLKQMIMEQSTNRLQQYESKKVICRSEQKYSVLDTKTLLAMKKKRMEAVYTRGFLSDPKELYRTLGDPTLDAENLLYDALQIDTGNDKNRKFESEAQKEATQQKKQQAKMKMKFREVPKLSSNGFRYIKDKLSKSNTRIGSVKFGVPFTEVCEKDEREHVYDTIQTVSNNDKKVDWNNLEIDEDKKTFFINVYNKYITSQKTDEPEHVPKPKKKYSIRTKQSASPESAAGKIKYSSKQIESALGIKREDHTSETTDKFFSTRDDFYEQRNRLNYRLSEDLDRLDHDRKQNFQRKVRAFDLSKKAQCLDDLNTMRQKAHEEKRDARKKLIESHPWFNELINKVVVLNGVKRDVTPAESIILDHIRGLIEDQVRFTKQVFLHLIRLLPTKDFLKDEVQRIIRFVKSHEIITERDYLEVVELSGHAIQFEAVA
ncbi:hypothetical protein HDV06_004052 [Boothiomyces sp. JEL0866]|nr:hypothetical protein HDV06_004052 [Boothiomyces sp. JEL0866]